MTRWKRISVKDVPVPDGHIIGRDWEEVAGWGGGQIDGEDLPAPVAAKPPPSAPRRWRGGGDRGRLQMSRCI